MSPAKSATGTGDTRVTPPPADAAASSGARLASMTSKGANALTGLPERVSQARGISTLVPFPRRYADSVRAR